MQSVKQIIVAILGFPLIIDNSPIPYPSLHIFIRINSSLFYVYTPT